MEPSTVRYDFLGLTAIVASEPMKMALALARRVATTRATVLIEGESGSGKEVIARAIHHWSNRAARPWVDINCGALPEQLMESELFGHERGAFSGADTAKPGLFELADGGTVFLDEISELDLRMQVKLLRVLDGLAYYRLGGIRKVVVDVRIVAATNSPLSRATGEGRFRNDLLHRLSMVRIEVPPLRQRQADIEPLVRHFLWQQGAEKELTAGAWRALLAHPWPGNVRELRNVICRATLLADGPRIEESHLGLASCSAVNPGPPGATRPGPPLGDMSRMNLDGLERQAILAILRQTNGHRQRAADLLGISRRTLSRKLKQYSQEDQSIPLTAWATEAEVWQGAGAAHGKTA